MKLKLVILALLPLFFVGCLNDIFDEGDAEAVYDGPPQVELKPLQQEVSEIDGTASIDVQLIGEQRTAPTTVTISADESSSAVEGTHYEFVSTELTIAPETSVVSAEINILDSGVFESGSVSLVVNIDSASDGVIPAANLSSSRVIISEFERGVSLSTQALDLRVSDSNLLLTGVTGQIGDVLVITTNPSDGDFTGETIVGTATLQDDLRGDAAIVNVSGASPTDHVAHIIRGSQVSSSSLDNGTVSAETLGFVAASSGVAPIYAVAQFSWDDETVVGPTSSVTIDVIELLYTGTEGVDEVSIDLHAVDAEGNIGAFIGVSADDLAFNTVHNNVVVEVVEAVDPSDDAPVRTDSTIEETGDFFAMVHLGAAGTDVDGNRIPAQNPAMTTAIVGEDGLENLTVGDSATVTVDEVL